MQPHTAGGETPTQASVPICPALSLWLVNWDELHNNADCNADKNMKHLNVITQRSFKVCALCLQLGFHLKTYNLQFYGKIDLAGS